MQWMRCPRGNGEMHDEDVRPARELDELRVRCILVGAEHDGHAARLNAISQSRDVAVWNSHRGHGHTALVEHCRWLCFRHIGDTDLETNSSTGAGRYRRTQRP